MKTTPGGISIKGFRVKPEKKVKLRDYDTGYTEKELTKQQGEDLLDQSRKLLQQAQDKLYAHNHYSVLIILQAMDAAGKDSVVKHIMSGFNPLGVKVHSFKAPTLHELDHDYFWRHYLALPARGEIAIHNRSHYENVLVTRIHPDLVLKERIPGIDSVKKINKEFWQERFKQINRFEKNLAENGTVVLKFFLHLSADEQKKRLLERIDDPSKNWKFELGDLRERARWDDYQKAYEEAISATSTEHAPWHIIPADDKWYTRLAIASVILQQFDELAIEYPIVSSVQKAELQKARAMLIEEQEEETPAPKKKKTVKKAS